MKKNRIILIVEDEKIISFGESKLLKQHGYGVLTADTGEKAIEIIKTDSSIDLILMDIELGAGIDGTEAAKQILEIRNLPIVFLTSHSEQEIVERVRKITRYGYVIKDSGDCVLISSIEMAFELFYAHQKLDIMNDELNEINRTLQEKEKALIKSQQRAHIGNWNFDPVTGQIEWSEEMYRIFGLDPKTCPVTFEQNQSMIQTCDRTLFDAAATNALSSMIPFEIEIKIDRPDGTTRNLMNWCTVEINPEGRRTLSGTTQDITERRMADKEIKKTKEHFEMLFNTIPDAVALTRLHDGNIINANDRFFTLTGYTRDELFGKKTIDLNIWKNQATRRKWIDLLLEKGVCEGFEVLIQRKDGSQIICLLSGILIEFEEIPHIISIAHDITERKQAEEKIKKLLEEKELLIKEVHHRIKNNIEVIIGLLTLQSGKLKDPKAKEAFKDSCSRLHSMGVLYDKLYRSDNICEIPVNNFLTSLIHKIINIFPNSESVKLETKIDDFILSAKEMSSLGIIVNELLTNAMKYAFTGRDDGLIKISASLNEDHAVFVIEDNGNKIPEAVDICESSGFGFQLVDLLIKQLKGSIHLERHNGSKFTIKFTPSKELSRI